MKPRLRVTGFFLCMVFIFLSACVYKSKLPPLAKKEIPGNPILIRNASLFTGERGAPVLEHTDILIDRGKIIDIGTITSPDQCRVIDATGKMVIPGLIDQHVHISSPGNPPWFTFMPDERLYERNLSAFLYAGVTTVFDVGGPSADIEKLAGRMKTEDTINPRILYVGKVFNKKGGHPDYMIRALAPWPFDAMAIRNIMYGITEKDEVGPALADNIAHGSRMTKIMIDQLPFGVPSLDDDLAGEIVLRSKKQGFFTAAHIGSESDMITGLNAGVPLFEHAPYRSSLSNATILRLKESGAAVIPTLGVFEASADFFSQSRKFTDLDKAIIDPNLLEAYTNTPPDAFNFDDPRIEAWVHDLLTFREIKFDTVRRMKAAGIPLIVGTDSPNVATVPGSSMHTEMRLLVEKCGFTPVEALSAATGESGRMIERITGEKGLGRIEKGGLADLIIINADFRKDITRTQDINMVISNGRIVNRNQGL